MEKKQTYKVEFLGNIEIREDDIKTPTALLEELNNGPLLSWRFEDGVLIPTIKATEEEIQTHFDSLSDEEKERIDNIGI